MKIKKRYIVSFIIIAAIGAAGYYGVNRKTKVEYTTVKAVIGKLEQTVSETGTVKAAKEIDLNFLATGKIANLRVLIGDKVSADQVLAELDYGDLIIKSREAQANLDYAKANLSKLYAGASSEDISVTSANLRQAEAAYNSALADLEKIKNKNKENILQAEKTLNDLINKTDSDVTTYEQAVSVAETSLNNTKSTYQKSIDNYKASALTTMDSKLSVADTALDNIDRVVNDTDAKEVLSVKNDIYLANTKTEYTDGVALVKTANASLSKAKSSNSESDINKALSDSTSALNKVFSALNNCYNALENTISTFAFTQAELDTFKTNINTQITAVSTGISSVESAKQNLDVATLTYNTKVSDAEKSLAQAKTNLDDAILTAKNSLASAKITNDSEITQYQGRVSAALEALEVAKTQLTKVKAKARPEDVSLMNAQISQSEAALDAIKKQIDNSIIKAPIGGIITKVNYEIGEQPQAASSVISMVGENNFEVEVLISEADVVKIAKGDPVNITLDAFGEDVKFTGQISFIEPAETVVQDVVYYKVTVIFTNLGKDLTPSPLLGKGEGVNAEGIKSGMTANVVVSMVKKDNVLMIPNRAIIEKESGVAGKKIKIVRVLKNNKVEEVVVESGLRGDKGMIEILSGLKEKDEVVTFVKEIK